jgi:hypothetical protein
MLARSHHDLVSIGLHYFANTFVISCDDDSLDVLRGKSAFDNPKNHRFPGDV